jgi:hypothetical protein
MKTKRTRKLKNATIKRHRSRYQQRDRYHQRGGANYIQTQRIDNDRYKIITAETHDNRVVNFYLGKAKAIFPAGQGCGRESICPQNPNFLFHGKGMLYSLHPANVFLIYEGTFKNNERSGKGKQTWFRSKGPKHYGIQTPDDLERMTMEQVNQLMHSLTTNNDILEVYEGTWKNDMKHGKGTCSITRDKSSYVGDFQNGMMHGKGKLKINNDVYHGDFQNGQMHGNGKLVYQTGSEVSYEGGWYEGKMHGLGKIVYRDGNTHNVEYDNGNLVRYVPIGSVFGRAFYSHVTPAVFSQVPPPN